MTPLPSGAAGQLRQLLRDAGLPREFDGDWISDRALYVNVASGELWRFLRAIRWLLPMIRWWASK